MVLLQVELILQRLQGVADRLVSWILPVRCPQNGPLALPWLACLAKC